MIYAIYKKIGVPGYGTLFTFIYCNNNLALVKNEICKRVMNGVPAKDLRIVEEIDYEFEGKVVTDRDLKQDNDDCVR